MKVFLIGFMGSGKTTVGKKLAGKLNMDFIDTDQWIEEKEKTTIRKIFENKGEKHFRKLENDSLKKLSGEKQLVISTGGGLPCHSNNIEFMNEEGLTIYLEMTPEQLFSRLKYKRDTRPLLKGKSDEEIKQFIKLKLSDREPFYQKAHIITNGFSLDYNDLINIITKSTQ